MKKIFIVMLLALSMGASAQFFTPVTKDRLSAEGERGLKGNFFIRPEFSMAGNIIKPVYIDDKFDSFKVGIASRVGFGASYALYKLVNDEPYNVYSFGLLVTAATDNANAGVLVTASAFDLYGLSPSVGLGYDFIKSSPFKANWFLMWGLNKTF